MIEGLFIVFLIMTLLMLNKMNKIKKNDKVLYEFCDVRRKMMSYLRSNFETISKDDYLCLRQSIELLNNNIHYFDHYKTHIFNITVLVQMIRDTKNNIEKLKEFKTTQNKDILELISSFERSFLVAFFVFTPLFKTKIFISIVVFFLSVSIKATMCISKEYANKIKNAITALEIIQEKKTCYAM